ncbi:ABC transporter ATP-binding protein [Gayadomonas joobiniege]|uniref:ABC transporter ATP-binding protein n=1 Tax=Gayadomonas joobiniege TaxID=1234606 RepID=UPI00036538FD|nr:ABC transporter ATP-binding protein [Gayadomonas joobiniege]
MQTQLDVHKLSVCADNKQILSELSFTTHGQGITAIVGPNGAGKTSLLRAIYGAMPVQSGQILLSGEPLTALTPRQKAKKLAVVTQNNVYDAHLTVEAMLKLGRVPHLSLLSRIGKKELALIESTMALLQITALRSRDFAGLSGGEQQRVLIARALIQEPELLILDEPCNHLDIHYQHQILALLKQLDVAVLMTIHDLNLAAQYAHQVILLNNGCIEAAGTAENVLNKHTIEGVFKLAVHVDRHPLTGAPYVFYKNQCEGN